MVLYTWSTKHILAMKMVSVVDTMDSLHSKSESVGPLDNKLKIHEWEISLIWGH